MKMRYASAAPRTLPPIDASRRMVRQPISAIGSNGPHVVARCANAICGARPIDSSVAGWAGRQLGELVGQGARLVGSDVVRRHVRRRLVS